MNRNVTKTVTHHILPCLGLLIVEAVSCVLAVYGIVILLGHDAPSLYCVLSGIPEAGTNTCSRSWTTRNLSF